MVAESRTLEPVAVQGIDDVAAGNRSISENRKRKLRPSCPGSRSHITGAGPRGVDYLTALLAKPRFWRQSQVIIQVEEWPVRIRPDSLQICSGTTRLSWLD